MRRLKVLMIRERDELFVVSSCCPRLGGDFNKFLIGGRVEYAFPERRKIMKELGALYMRLKEAFGEEIEIEYIDPRNYLPLFVRLIKDVLEFRPSFLHALRVITLAFPFPAIIANGRLIASYQIEEPERIVGKLKALLETGALDKGHA